MCIRSARNDSTESCPVTNRGGQLSVHQGWARILLLSHRTVPRGQLTISGGAWLLSIIGEPTSVYEVFVCELRASCFQGSGWAIRGAAKSCSRTCCSRTLLSMTLYIISLNRPDILYRSPPGIHMVPLTAGSDTSNQDFGIC